MALRFGAYILDTVRFEIRTGSGVVHVEPQVFDVVRYLVENRHRVVSKDELLAEVWGSRFVSESTLTSRIKAARRALGDDGQSQSIIQTVRGRGFRFVADVVAEGEAAAPDGMDPGNGRSLPTMVGPLVGRSGELADLVRLISEARLVTLVGPGGVGKTRCAIEAATRASTQMDVTAHFVDLTPVADTTGVAEAIAAAVGLPDVGTGRALDLLATALRHDRRLLLIDNFEHLTTAAGVVASLLAAAPGVRVLVTSRERLHLSGERLYPLGPLEVESPQGQAPAVALFEAAAVRLRPNFTIDAENEDDVRALCRAVDGLPLGIELIAANVRLFTPGQLRTHLGDRLAVLTAGDRDVHGRHRTLRDTLDWSVRLLSDDERSYFARLSVFRGGADLDAVEHVCRPGLDLDSLAAIAALADKSLLRRQDSHRDRSPTFTMLELVHERAWAELRTSGDETVTRHRHASYFRDLIHDIESRRWDELSAMWVAMVRERFADVVAAVENGFGGDDAVLAASTVAGLHGYLHRAVAVDTTRRWLTQATAHSTALSSVERGWIEEAAGYLNFRLRDTRAARAHYQAALEHFDAAGNDRYRALAMVDVAGTWMGDGEESAQAIALCERGVRLSREVGELPLLAHAVNVLGELVRLAGDDVAAWAAYEEGIELTRRFGDESHRSVFEQNLCMLALHRGDAEDARAFATTALRRMQRCGDQLGIANSLSLVAGAEAELGRFEVAARWLGAADAGLIALDATRPPGDEPEYQRVRSGLESALGSRRLASLLDDGAQLSLGEATDEVLVPAQDRGGSFTAGGDDR